MNFEARSNKLESDSINEQPREIEVKIVNLGNPEKFINRLKSLGGVEVTSRRLIKDISFQEKKEVSTNRQLSNRPDEINFDLSISDNPEDLENIFNFLGLEVIKMKDNQVRLKAPQIMPSIGVIRLRIDNQQTILTVKEKRTKGAMVDNRVEMEAKLNDDASIRKLLFALGYEPGSYREKYRTSYKLGSSLVELNEGPIGSPWAEIEAGSEDAVKSVANKLGYTPQDLGAISDYKYYETTIPGITTETLNRLSFNKTTFE